MAMNFKRRLPIPKEIREEMPLRSDLVEAKQRFDEQVAAIFRGEDDRRVLIIGPCSADREDSVLDYMTHLAKLQERVVDRLVIIPRVYTNKPRTKGTGYKGLLHNPDPEAPADLLEGVKAIRHMHLRVIEETGFFTADEMLYPSNYQYLIDLLSYVAIGARSVENQEHRLVSSGVPVPVGMKNPTAGSTTVMLNSIYAAQAPQSFIYRNWEVETEGNPLAHAVLRGYIGLDGRTYPNYHYEHLERLAERYTEEAGYANPAVIVDCNHDNSGKRPFEQLRICKEVLDSCRRNEDVSRLVRGFMVESYLEDGNQPVDGGVYGKSITDACIGWEKTERLVLNLAERV
ncbi:3-deoxy-7-phosphoheptulonate synthase [Collinsella provencensis]|uniref:3-deoxy-7-phosphoheptulonate synthase n=1 Tax=Collinsella provencensis TaxID=1937461 RepID=UPI000C81D427|nr:3-deoxy-7-phosphoheptulonate synthase [Collinsella provencensis]